VDIERNRKHPLAQKLLDKIAGADILVVSMAENGKLFS
jgi:NAD(P)H-dependent FMN reductase